MNILLSFQGRIGRLQFWLTGLGLVVFYMAVFMAAGIGASVDPVTNLPSFASASLLLMLGAFIIGTWVNLSAMARRYHDRNKSGWWFFICLVPIVGPIWQFIELGFLSGTPGGNDYGVRGQTSGSSWSDDEQDEMRPSNNNLDDLIQQRLVERQQQQIPSSQNNANVALSGNGNALTNERPVFGRRT